MKPQTANKGFSIIEAIASCIILGIAVVALINFFPTSSIMNARANRMNEASVLAEDLIEWFRCAPFDTLKDFIEVGNDTGTHVIGGPLAGERFTRTWNLTDNGNIIQAEVNCSWRNPGNPGRSTVRLVTQISNHD